MRHSACAAACSCLMARSELSGYGEQRTEERLGGCRVDCLLHNYHNFVTITTIKPITTEQEHSHRSCCSKESAQRARYGSHNRGGERPFTAHSRPGLRRVACVLAQPRLLEVQLRADGWVGRDDAH